MRLVALVAALGLTGCALSRPGLRPVLAERSARWEHEAGLEGETETFGAESNPTGNPIGGGEGYTDVLTRAAAGSSQARTTRRRWCGTCRIATAGERRVTAAGGGSRAAPVIPMSGWVRRLPDSGPHSGARTGGLAVMPLPRRGTSVSARWERAYCQMMNPPVL